MRRKLLCGSSALLFLSTVVACAPDYYNRGYYGYGPYGAQAYGYGPSGGAQYAPGPYAAAPYNSGSYMAPASYVAPQALSRVSYDFVINAALSDMYEIQAGNIARTRAASPAVRQLADRMVRDHTMTSQQLMATLQANGTPILTPQTPDPRHQGMIADLQMAQGGDFDRRYVMQQVMAHQEAVSMLQNYAQTGDNPALRQLAAQTLPMIQDHLRMAQMLAGTSG